mmetsp:Transcript_52950/g.136776  ORF Transcript_52950/g.136776 Transcript_52950/m.136776 type:complete len:98 (-) Transcript_52950:202-495(-)
MAKTDPAAGWCCDGCSQGMDDVTERFRCTEGCDYDYCAACNAKVGAAAEAMPPQLVLLDIPDTGGYYVGPQGQVTTEAIEKLLEAYKAKGLERKQLA